MAAELLENDRQLDHSATGPAILDGNRHGRQAELIGPSAPGRFVVREARINEVSYLLAIGGAEKPAYAVAERGLLRIETELHGRSA